MGLRVGKTFNSQQGGATGDELFYKNTLADWRGAAQAGASFDLAMVETWYPHPLHAAPETTAYTTTNTAKAVFDLAAGAAPAEPVAPAEPARGATTSPKHVAVFLIDDLGYGDTGHMGAEFATPHIDSLALGGVRLNQTYVTQLCSPSRASLLSSRYAYEIGMDGNVLGGGDARCINTSVSTLGDQMARMGVKTAFIGKYDVGYSAGLHRQLPRLRLLVRLLRRGEDYYLHGSKTRSTCTRTLRRRRSTAASTRRRSSPEKGRVAAEHDGLRTERVDAALPVLPGGARAD